MKFLRCCRSQRQPSTANVEAVLLTNNEGTTNQQSDWKKFVKSWDKDTRFAGVKATSFGEIKFDRNPIRSKFICLEADHVEKAVDAAWTLLTKHWLPEDSRRPDVVLSFYRSEDDGQFRFAHEEKTQKTLLNNLATFADDTRTWLITDAHRCRYGKTLGEQVFKRNCMKMRRTAAPFSAPEHGVQEMEGHRLITCIGFPDLYDKKEFFCKDGENDLTIVAGIGEYANLDYGHNYYLFYDYKKANKREDEFRSQFEQKIANEEYTERVDKIDRKTVVIRLMTSNERQKIGVAVANDDAFRQAKEMIATCKTENCDGKCIKTCKENLQEKIEIWTNESELRDAIIALLSKNLQGSQVLSAVTLKLAMRWYDAAKSRPDNDFVRKHLSKSAAEMHQAIAKPVTTCATFDGVAFLLVEEVRFDDVIERFLKEFIPEFVRAKRMLTLYKETRGEHIDDLLGVIGVTQREDLKQEHITKLLRHFCEGFKPLTDKDPRYAFHEIIIYAIFFCREDRFLDLCLECCARPLLAAFYGMWLSDRLQSFFKRLSKEEMTIYYSRRKSYFMRMAIQLLDIALYDSFEAANDVVNTYAEPMWPDLQLIEIAARARALDVFDHECIQRPMFKRWITYDGPEQSPKRFLTPRQKFINHTVIYLIFLTLYSYALLFATTDSAISTAEKIVYGIQLTHLLVMLMKKIFPSRESRESSTSRESRKPLPQRKCDSEELPEELPKQDDIRSEKEMNRPIWLPTETDTITNILFPIVIVCRIVGVHGGLQVMLTLATLLMTFNFVLYVFKLLKFFSASPGLGAKAVILWNMTKELVLFMAFFGIFSLAFGIANQKLAHPEEQFHSGMFWQLLKRGLWEIFGEIDDPLKNGNVSNCTAENLQNSTDYSRGFDCEARSIAIVILLAGYMFIITLLLVNLVIAACTNIFDEANKRAGKIWRFNMYILLSEYEKSDILSWLFPPAKPKDETDASATDSNTSKKDKNEKQCAGAAVTDPVMIELFENEIRDRFFARQLEKDNCKQQRVAAAITDPVMIELFANELRDRFWPTTDGPDFSTSMP